MRAPEFWRADATGRDAAPMVRALLTPLSWIYAGVSATRIAATTPQTAPVPVLCVGNVSMGGVGKTPLVRAIRARLAARGLVPHVVSRGHGGRLKGPVRVDPVVHDFRAVGDEPLLHARDGATWIARDRAAGAAAAAAAGAHLVILDDGFQNPTLRKDLSLVAIDAREGLGNGQVAPAGPLREPPRAAFARADAVVIVGPGDPPRFDPKQLNDRPILRATIEPAAAAPDGPLVAFAGIGRPEKFFDTLSALGATLSETVPFADHHPYTEQDLAFLETLASERGARLVTTEKDHVRLPARAQSTILALPVTARFADSAALDRLLDRLAAQVAP